MRKPQAIFHETSKAELLHGGGEIGYRWTDSFSDPLSPLSRLLGGPGTSIPGGSWSERFEMRIPSLQVRCSLSPILFCSAVLDLKSRVTVGFRLDHAKSISRINPLEEVVEAYYAYAL